MNARNRIREGCGLSSAGRLWGGREWWSLRWRVWGGDPELPLWAQRGQHVPRGRGVTAAWKPKAQWQLLLCSLLILALWSNIQWIPQVSFYDHLYHGVHFLGCISQDACRIRGHTVNPGLYLGCSEVKASCCRLQTARPQRAVATPFLQALGIGV